TAGCPVNNRPVKSTLTSREAEALAASRGVTATWNSTYAERTFSYSKTYSGVNANNKPVSCTVKRTVWFEEAAATLKRGELVGEYKLAGIAQWAVGGEDAGQWSRLGDYARSITRVSPRVELFAGDAVYGGVVNVHATVRFASGAPVVGEDWTLSWRDRDSTTWAAVASGTTSSTGTMSALRKPTRTGYWRLWVGGSWSRYSAQTEQNRTLVRTKVVAGLSRTSVTKGSTVTVKGTIAPAVTGLVVQRQRLVGGSWVDAGPTATTVSGKFALPVVASSRGTFTYRVKVSGAVYRGNGYSPRMILTVS
ncbi:MAG TPA: hypothetical protein VEV13_00070, partial [Candidatus Limnocylindria bacterium]|nr:hypothetical protein [Candidatus Limnocylindria bacterium]